jgi:DNA-binding response OmpR family regulator
VRILFVEDDPDTASAMARLLTYHGHQVQTAASVGEALSAWRGGQFDLLITDIGLPDGSGLNILRALSESHPVKAIVISGLGLDEQLQESREAGIAEHLVKPVSLNVLQASIRRLTG